MLWGCNGRSSRPAARPADAIGPATCWQVFLEREGPRLRRQKLALVAHRPTRTLLDSLLDKGFSVVRVYAPEHGLFGEKAAGHRVEDTIYRGVPVVSLYGRRKAPTPEELAQAEAVIFALRDVGVRHYTYLSTLALLLEAAAQAQRPVYVLDFPNPHAHYTYGPLLDSSLFSFVGMHAVPLVPGLSIGEYAQLLVGEGWVPRVPLIVVPWPGWRRGDPLPKVAPFFTEPPSPALRDTLALELYPILGWYEGVPAVSVGRGTDRPFQQVGLATPALPPRLDTVIYGYRLEPVTFQPDREKTLYTGWRLSRVYRGPVQPDSLFRVGFWLLRTFRQAWPPSAGPFFQEEFFDKLFGTPLLRWMEEKNLPIDTLYRAFEAPTSWQALRQRYATLY